MEYACRVCVGFAANLGRLVQREDQDVSDAIREILEREGVEVRLNAKCIRFSKRGDTIAALWSEGFEFTRRPLRARRNTPRGRIRWRRRTGRMQQKRAEKASAAAAPGKPPKPAKVEEVTDGLDKTIYLLQVGPG